MPTDSFGTGTRIRPAGQRSSADPSRLDGMSQMPLPRSLERVRPQLEASLRPCVLLATRPDGRNAAGSSRIGGLPYLMPGEPWPADEQGLYLFLAQINYAELPPLEGHPREGLLRFFIGEGLPRGRVAGAGGRFLGDYLPTIDSAASLPESASQPIASISCPLLYPDRFHPLVGKRAMLPITYDDHRFDDLVGRTAIGVEAVEEYHQISHLNQNGAFHQLGGYPFFAQEDWRAADPDSEDYQLLLQLDSQSEVLKWGNFGVASFWIRPEDLAARDFSRTLYHWDCI